MRLFIIRHGQSVNNANAREPGFVPETHDDPLTETGMLQAELLGQYFRDWDDPHPSIGGKIDLTHIFTSPMLRTLQTSYALGMTLGITPEVWLDLYECGGLSDEDTGQAEAGLGRRDIRKQFPLIRLPRELTHEGWWQGAEDRMECLERALILADKLIKRAKQGEQDDYEERIAVVTHGGFANALLRGIAHMPIHEKRLPYFFHNNTGVTQVLYLRTSVARRLGALTAIHYLNNLEHLPRELITD